MMFLRPLIVVVLAAVRLGGCAQHPLGTQTPPAGRSESIFRPLDKLAALHVAEFTTLAHPKFPEHSVRIKKSRFCDGGVQAYTGYIDTHARHLFFYFFESRRDPATDDVVMWTNGGPGSSSALGLFMELGPCRVTGPNSTERFEFGWNEHANIFFIDQPAGVGFSYVDHGPPVASTLEGGDDIAIFMAIFFEHFSEFRGRPFHLAGESYAGRYLPVFASAIYDKNEELVEAGMSPINLTSVMIGNGGINFLELHLSHYDALCTKQGYPFVYSISDCIRMKTMVPRCEKRFKAACQETYDEIECAAAERFCEDTFFAMFEYMNPYDATRPCFGHPDSEDCYPILKDTVAFLNNPDTQVTLGIDPSHRNYSLGDEAMNRRFLRGSDLFSYRAEWYIAALLERGVRVLLYAGTNDIVSHWVGIERVTFALEWSAQAAYREAQKRDWLVDGEVAGQTRSGGGLTFATIYGAGHLAPFDQPERSLAMANRWLAAEDL